MPLGARGVARFGPSSSRAQKASEEMILLRSRAADGSRARKQTTALIRPAWRKSSCVAFVPKSGDEREKSVGDAEERGEGFGRLPAQGGGARGCVYEHERQVEAEREVQAATRERDVREAPEGE